HDVRSVLRCGAEKCADPICRRSHFLNDFLEFLNHPPCLDHCLLLIENLRPQFQQITPNWIARRQRGNDSIECVDEIVRTRVPDPVQKPLAALVAHLWFGSIRRTKSHYSFIKAHSQSFDAALIQNVQPTATVKVARGLD